MFLMRCSLLSAAVMVTLFVVSGAYAVETDPVVAKVNGHQVRLSDVENARNLLPSKMQGAPLRDVYPVLMESLINSRLAADKAVKLGFKESPEYVHRMARISDQILERILLARHIEQNLTNAGIKKRYEQVVERAKTQSEIHARHILVKNEDHAKALIDLLKDGADFAKLAREQSQGPTKSRGGDLGWFGPGKMVEAFEEAAKAIPTGTFSGAPVKTQFGWHVIKVEERRAMSIPIYQDVREVLANELSAELGQTFMEQLRAEASIEKKSFEEIVKALQD